MKKVLFFFALLLSTMTAGAQKYTVRNHKADAAMTQPMKFKYPDSIRIAAHVYNAGGYLRMSAGMDALAWGMAAASGLAYSGVVYDDRRSANMLGTIFAVASVVTKVMSVHYKSKAGTEMTLAPGAVVVRF